MWIEFAEQWDAKSPWHDRRVRLAVNHALDRRAISETACLGYCPSVGVIVPPVMDYALKVEPPHYDPQKARQLLAEAGYPQGFDAGDFTPLPGFSIAGEAAVNYLNAVGIRTRMRVMERAAFYAAWQEKKLRGLFLTAAGNSGNAARAWRRSFTRKEATPMAAILTSTSCSSNRRGSGIPRNARSCSTVSSNSQSTA